MVDKSFVNRYFNKKVPGEYAQFQESLMVKVNLGRKSFDDLKIAIQGLRLPAKNPVLSIDDPRYPEIVTVRGVSVRDLNPLVLIGYAVFQTAA